MATDLTGTAPPDDLQDESSLRDDIDAAFEQHATDEVDELKPGEPESPGLDRPRDAAGRFAKATDAPAEGATSPVERAAAAAGTQGTPAPAHAPAPDLRAPASWTPAAREKWGALDPTIRAEVTRREQEGQRLLQETAGVREFARAFQETVRPYEMFIRMEGSDPLRAVQSLMQTAAAMKMGSAQDKVDIVAEICRGHQVDMRMLDNALARIFNPDGSGAQQQQQFRDPRVDQLLAMQEAQQAQAQAQAQQRDQFETRALQQGLSEFAANHEFYGDVRTLMADMVDAANHRGQPIDLEAIYQRACVVDPEVSKILEQRSGASPAAGRSSQAVLRARRAAVSLKGEPTPPGATVPKGDDIRSAIEAAIDSQSG